MGNKHTLGCWFVVFLVGSFVSGAITFSLDPPGSQWVRLNVGVPLSLCLSEPDTLCFTVKLLLHHAASERKDGEALHVDYISPPWGFLKSEWERNPPGRRGLTTPELPHFIRRCCITMWYVDDIFWKRSCLLLFSHRDICDNADLQTRNLNERRTFFCALRKWGSDFIKTQKMARRRSRRQWARIWVKWEGKGQMQQQHEIFFLLQNNDTKGGKTVEVDETKQHQWRRSGHKFWVAHNEQKYFAARYQIRYFFLIYQSSIFLHCICYIFDFFFSYIFDPDPALIIQWKYVISCRFCL